MVEQLRKGYEKNQKWECKTSFCRFLTSCTWHSSFSPGHPGVWILISWRKGLRETTGMIRKLEGLLYKETFNLITEMWEFCVSV